MNRPLIATGWVVLNPDRFVHSLLEQPIVEMSAPARLNRLRKGHKVMCFQCLAGHYSPCEGRCSCICSGELKSRSRA